MPAAPKSKSTSDRVPRPPNSFMLYRADQLTNLPPLPPGRSNAWTQPEISGMASKSWKSATPEVKAYWKERADAAKVTHELLYPDYRYQPTRKEDKPKRKPQAQKTTRSSSSQLSGSTESSLSPPALAAYGEPMSAFESQSNDTGAPHVIQSSNQVELPLLQPELGQAGGVAFNGTAQPEGLNSHLGNQYYLAQWAYHYFGNHPNFNGDPIMYANDEQLVQAPTGPLNVEISHIPNFGAQAFPLPNAAGYGVQAERDPSFGGRLGQGGLDAGASEATSQSIAPLPMGDELVQEPTGPLEVEIGHVPYFDAQASFFPDAAGHGVQSEYGPYSGGLWGQDFGDTGATEASYTGDVDAAYPNQMLEGFWDFDAPLNYNFTAAQLAE
ncbi:hypothetical protein D9615_010554 [Tricholomella constricta]|uniref:HMG box domain-containing protein n=1 Tax=Tricholomella constricta TaxID=117010 RepID=A0A8H5M171_9AGAR|nr:hypothetical protein D9615_010554 [Tricholomella constricta]